VTATSWNARVVAERAIGVAALGFALVGPLVFSGYFTTAILTQTFIFGIAAASLIFLSAYGGMISLAQTALMGIAGYVVGNLVTKGGAGGETKGLVLGWDPTLALVLALVITTAIGLLLGAVASRSFGIYFLMLTLTFGVIANYFFGQVTILGGFSPIAGINQYTPPFVGDILGHPDKLYYIALGVSLAVYLVMRYVVRTPFGLSVQGLRDEPVRLTSLGYNVPLHRALAFAFGAFVASLAGVLYVWWDGQIAPQNLGLGATIDLLIIAVIGGLGRIEGAWLGAFAFIVINNYVRDIQFPFASEKGVLPWVGGSFNTVIGVVFLLIVLVSPDGLMGLWDRMWGALHRRGGPAHPDAEGVEAAAGASP
jgi:branched-chain amino acid transport system permease protein